jgi:CopG family transcriptional regulator, nickel-responsive regulator
LLAKFDRYIRRHKYANRSEAVRDLIRRKLIEEEWQADGEVVGVISLVYDHHQYRLQDKLTEEQHRLHHLVVSATHIHLSHSHCLEVIIARGPAGQVRALSELLTSLRGVKDGHLSMSSAAQDLA